MQQDNQQNREIRDLYWFPDGNLTNGIGYVTDEYDEYVEIQDKENKKFYIVEKTKLIKK